MKNLNKKIVVIVGPTGSGKTGVGIEIAKEINGEIISADSRAIYKGMDIGTAKPDEAEMDGIVHYGLDLVEPGERFTVADWKEYAEQKIEEIFMRGKRPIVVGGTGLYVDALIYDYEFTDDVKKTCSDRTEMGSEYLVVGVDWKRGDLRQRIRTRIDKMFDQKLFDETKNLVRKYGWESGAMKSNIYKFVWEYLEGEKGIEEAKEGAFYEDWHLAKRQMTWFKRNENIVWLPLEKIKSYVLKCIQDE